MKNHLYILKYLTNYSFNFNKKSVHKIIKSQNYKIYDYSNWRTFSQYLPLNLGLLAFFGLGSKKSEVAITNDDWSREKDINHYISSAENAIKDGNLKKAEFILKQALTHHESKRTVGVTSVYDMLATVAYRGGDLEKSRATLEEVIAYLGSSGLSPDHSQLVSFRLKLARILSKLGKANEADGYFRQCLEIQKLKHQIGSKGEEDAKLRINCLFWYGKHLLQNKKFADAKHCFDTAYTLTTRVNSFDNNQVMVILYNLSEAMQSTGETDGAIQNLLNAVIIGRMTNCPDLGIYCTKLGALYLAKGLLQEARHWCENGRDCAKKCNDKSAQAEGEYCINQINEALKLGPLKV